MVKIEFQKESLIKSPLNYVGGKFKLLPQILPLFPDNINRFIDLFCGGCNVGINVVANEIIFNDINTYLIPLLIYFKNNNVDKILLEINNIINTYQLDKHNKNGFWKLREDFNNQYNPVQLYVLICFSFNQRMRISTKNKYNSAFREGLNGYNNKLEQNLITFVKRLNILNCNFTNKHFNDYNINEFNKNDFIYCDPPYLITNADYCKEGMKDWRWNEKRELQLLHFLDELNSKNIKFALNNVLEHHGKENTILKNWSKNYNISYLNYTYGNFNSQSTEKHIKNTIEVLITNY